MPPTPPDPEMFTILARIDSCLDGITARLERMEDALDDLRGTYQRLIRAHPLLARIAADRDWAQEEKELERLIKASQIGTVNGKPYEPKHLVGNGHQKGLGTCGKCRCGGDSGGV